MRHIALWMAKLAKRGKHVKNGTMWTKCGRYEKRAPEAKLVELSPVDPYERNLLGEDKKRRDQVDGPPIGHF